MKAGARARARILPWLTGAWLGAHQAAAAAPSSARLQWSREAGAEACISESEIMAAVRSRLGWDPFDRGAPARIEGSVERRGAFFHARVILIDAHGDVLGSRSFEARGPRCDDLGDAVVLALAMVFPSAPAESARESAAPPTGHAAALSGPEPLGERPPTDIAPARSSPADRSSPAVLALTLRSVASAGVLPPFGLGTGLSADVRFGRFHAAGGVLLLWPAQSDAGTAGARLSALGLEGCAEAAAGRFDAASLLICAGIQAGTFRFVRLTPESDETEQRAWLAGLLGPRFSFHPGPRWVLESGAELVIPFVRHQAETPEGARTDVAPQGGWLLFAGGGVTIP